MIFGLLCLYFTCTKFLVSLTIFVKIAGDLLDLVGDNAFEIVQDIISVRI